MVTTWAEFASNNADIARSLRHAADMWDAALTDAEPQGLINAADMISNCAIFARQVVDDMPHTPADVAASRVDLMEDK